MNLIRIILLVFLLPSLVSGQTPKGTGYRKDLIVLKKALEENYPSLYRFKSKAAINKLFEKSIQETANPTTERDFYKTLKRILSAVEDGHLSCSPPARLEQQFDEVEKYFPVSLYFTEDKAYVDCSNSSSLSSGTAITHINGMGIEAIRKELFNYIVSDGEIETKKYWILNRSFWFYFNLIYGPRETHRITYKNSNGQLQKTVVPAALRKDLQCRSLTADKETPLVDLKFLRPDMALLQIRTFAEPDLQSAHIDFAQFLEAAFRELKERKATSLLIDLRGNGGGRDVYGALLYSYLSDTTFRYYQKLETASGELGEKEHPNLAIQQPTPNRFSGKTYVLINGLTFSAASEFCTVVKANNRAVFIGEETGGTYCGNTSGDFFEVILPYSRFTIFLPTTKYTMVTTDPKNTNRGIIPNYVVTPSIRDLLGKKDVQLDFALQLAERESSR